MKKHFLLLTILLFVLTGCSQSTSNKIKVNNPYEVANGTSILSYYDTEESINIDGFNILNIDSDVDFQSYLRIRDQNENCIIINENCIIINEDGKIRCIYIANDDIVTYKQISVGDTVDKIEDSFEYEYKIDDMYYATFDGSTEEDTTKREDDSIIIMYFTDDSKITWIMIYDVLFGREER